jgi:acyl carrier protein
MKEVILQLIYEAIDETNELLDEDQKLVKQLDTKLYGPGAHLDSIELVNLIVSVEQKIEACFQIEITLADERLMQMKHNPFATIERFVEYVNTIVSEQKK